MTFIFSFRPLIDIIRTCLSYVPIAVILVDNITQKTDELTTNNNNDFDFHLSGANAEKNFGKEGGKNVIKSLDSRKMP